MDPIPLSKNGKSAAQVAREAALMAGKILMRQFYEPKVITFKGRGNLVTDVDTEVERQILTLLEIEYPYMSLLGEESDRVAADKGYVWIVDPIDGTRNYASGIPFFSVVIGLALDGEILVGVNYDPARDELFEAERGKGAFLNGKTICVSNKTNIADAILGMDLSYNDKGGTFSMEIIQTIWPEMQTTRIMGSAALGLSYVAAGRTDLYFHYQLEPWDQVAGILLLREAHGGIITDRTGQPASLHSEGIVASNRTLHGEFMRRTNGMNWRQPTNIIN